MDKKLNKFTGILRRAVDDYRMIEEGDRVAVGLSGGKDSMLLLTALSELQRYYPKHFSLCGITVELGFDGMDYTPVAEQCAALGVPYILKKTDIREIVFDLRKEENPCSLCAKMRRGALASVMREHNINKLALGHHFDDSVETFLMALLYEGQLSCFEPVTELKECGITQIRPMIYAGEERIRHLCEGLALPIVENSCPMDHESKRHEIKALLQTLGKDYPDVKSKIFGAMQRYPMHGWDIRKETKP